MTVRGARILIVEDDPVTSDILRTFFQGNGATVDTAADGLTGLKMFRERLPDIVLLDLMLPKLGGWEVLETINSQQVPIIAITAKDSVDEIVHGLARGLADYITKPFHLREVLARTQKALKRRQTERPKSFRIGDLSIDDGRKQVLVKDKLISLTRKEYVLLCQLAQQPGRVFSDRELIERVWPEGSLATSADVKRYVHLLRQKIEKNPTTPRYLQTVRGFGYKLEP